MDRKVIDEVIENGQHQISKTITQLFSQFLEKIESLKKEMIAELLSKEVCSKEQFYELLDRLCHLTGDVNFISDAAGFDSYSIDGWGKKTSVPVEELRVQTALLLIDAAFYAYKKECFVRDAHNLLNDAILQITQTPAEDTAEKGSASQAEKDFENVLRDIERIPHCGTTIRKAIEEIGIKTVHGLINCPKAKLTYVRGFGRHSLKYLNQYLQKHYSTTIQ